MPLENFYYIVNSFVIFETIQNETIAINLKNGYYYNLNNVASQIWSLIELNVNENEIIRIVCESYNLELAKVETELKTFLLNLKNEDLISSHSESVSNKSETKLFVPDRPYALPKFERYTDMSALLLADPVHEFSK